MVNVSWRLLPPKVRDYVLFILSFSRSRRARVDAAQLDEAAHVVGEVLHPDLRLGARDADRAHQRAAHVVGLRAEDMFDPDPRGGFGPVAFLRLLGQRLAALALAVDVALQLPVRSLASISSDR